MSTVPFPMLTVLPKADAAETPARILGEVLQILLERRGLDFSGYRRSTLERRLTGRMNAALRSDGDEYLALLRTGEGEIDRLIANLTIKVSRFYRNAAVFDALVERHIPDLRRCFGGEPLRVWSAGCAKGEEAYTLAMLLSDTDAMVVATDLDEAALEAARRGRYDADALTEVPEMMIADHLGSGEDGTIEVSERLRGRVEFLRHDLSSSESPMRRRFHLVCCRNVLIYFDRPLQKKVLRNLIDSVVPGGLLCLGEAEWPVEESGRLEVVDRRGKLFRRIGGEGESS
jgi:chemotaxis methyl-accepting protein methylase